MSTQDEFASIRVKEILYTIRPKFDNISRAVRVPNEIRLDAQVLI